MPDRLITHLRHVDLAVPDHGKQRDFFTGVWGLTAEHSDTGLTFLAAEGSPEQYVVRLRQVDEDTWHPHLYDFTQPEVADQWGTANAINEFVAAKSFNQPDRGLFTAPPV